MLDSFSSCDELRELRGKLTRLIGAESAGQNDIVTNTKAPIYRFLVAYHKEYGVYPSMREIAEGKIEGEQVITKVSASSAVKLTLDRLESRGWIRKGKHIPRGLEVLYWQRKKK